MSEHLLQVLRILVTFLAEPQVPFRLVVTPSGLRPRGLSLTRMIVAKVTELSGMFYSAVAYRP